jgi:periplasmic divalent cation tolerance protein
MFIAWTTVATAADADRLAEAVIARNLAVCVQIDGPIRSHFYWAGQKTAAIEWRLMLKLLPAQAAELSAFVHRVHPYETPEWVVVAATHGGEKYLSWANSPRNPINL